MGESMGQGSYWFAQDIFKLVGNAYLLAVLAGLAAALWFPKNRTAKMLWASLVLGLASIPVFKMYSSYKRQQEIQAIIEVRLAPARALFEEKCKTAGEVVHRRVEGVEAIYLVKGRPFGSVNSDDIMTPGLAALGDSDGDEYIKNFLFYELGKLRGMGESLRWPEHRGNLWIKTDKDAKYPGYQYVVVPDPENGQVYRYTLAMEGPYQQVVLKKELHTGSLPRYAVDYEDWMDPEIRRKYRLAGTTIKVIDRKTQEIIATKTMFLLDRGFDPRGYNGYTTKKDVCPDNHYTFRKSTRFFVDQVLKPTQEGN